jgi:hypothetical protein
MCNKNPLFSKAILISILLPCIVISCQIKKDNITEKLFNNAGSVTNTTAKGKYPRMAESLPQLNPESSDLFATLPRKDSFIYVYSAFKDTILYQISLDSVFKTIQSNYFDITGYYFNTMDSIFVATRNFGVFMINKKGTIINSTPIDDTIIHNKELDFTTYGNHPYFRNNKFYLGCQYSNYTFSTDTAVRRKFFNTPLVSVIDASSGKLINTILEYPAFYKSGKYYRSREPKRAVNGNQRLLVYSFHYSDSVYVINDNQEVKSYFASSKYFKHPKPYIGDSLRNRAYTKKYATVNGKFTDISYDPYRDLYYRILKHPIEYEADNNTINTPTDAKYSIIVLNKSFNKIYEHHFEPQVYDYYSNIIITREGLLLPLHRQNPDYKRGEWKYDLLKINKDEINS